MLIGGIATKDEMIPIEVIVEPAIDESRELEIFKSLQYLNDRFEFIERDQDGIKMRARTRFFGGEFPYEVGYVIISEYDDRHFLITKIDPQGSFVWFGTWEE